MRNISIEKVELLMGHYVPQESTDLKDIIGEIEYQSIRNRDKEDKESIRYIMIGTILKNGGNTMEEIRKKIKIIGSKVIDVGYRLHILEEAERRRITKLDIKNVKDEEKKKETVEILLGDDKEKVNEFIRWMRLPSNKPENANIDKDGIMEEDYSGDIITREEYYKIFTASQLAKMATSGGKLLETQSKIFETQKEISDSIKETVNLQKEISDSIKETVNLQKGISGSIRETVDLQINMETRISRFSGFGQEIINTQDEIKDKISQIGRDLKRYIDERIGKLEMEIVKRR